MVYQVFTVWPHLSVFDVVGFRTVRVQKPRYGRGPMIGEACGLRFAMAKGYPFSEGGDTQDLVAWLRSLEDLADLAACIGKALAQSGDGAIT